MLISILIAVVAASALIVFLILMKAPVRRVKAERTNVNSKKGRNTVIKDAERKLSHDPHNVTALTVLGEIYYNEKNWEKSWNIYKTLYEISVAHVEVDVEKSALRMGISAYKLDKIEESLTGLMAAMKKNPNNFEACYYLGYAFYKKNVYDKAIYCLKRAHQLNPGSSGVNEPLGFSLFKAQKYRDCLPFLKKVLDEHPDNKEAMYDMAIAMSETSMGDKALKIFMHLRPDPVFGPQCCLEAGKYHQKTKMFDQAIQDYEIAMKMPDVPDKILLQIKYNCGNCYIAANNINKGLQILKQVQNVNPGYKDIDSLVARYSELNQNSNLQTYLMAGTSDFVALCRKFITAYYPKGFVKVESVAVESECIEIICAVESGKWDDKEVFRFYRTSTVMGDIYVRDIHSKIRDSKADKGVAVTMGTFSESAHKFIEGRPIDLVEKDALIKILKKINMFG